MDLKIVDKRKNEQYTENMILNEKHRELYGEKLIDVANIAIGALVFGQFISEKGFSWELANIGFSVFIGCYFTSYFLIKERRKKGGRK